MRPVAQLLKSFVRLLTGVPAQVAAKCLEWETRRIGPVPQDVGAELPPCQFVAHPVRTSPAAKPRLDGAGMDAAEAKVRREA